MLWSIGGFAAHDRHTRNLNPLEGQGSQDGQDQDSAPNPENGLRADLLKNGPAPDRANDQTQAGGGLVEPEELAAVLGLTEPGNQRLEGRV